VAPTLPNGVVATCHANTCTPARAVAIAGNGVLASTVCRYVESEMVAVSDCTGTMACLLPDKGRTTGLASRTLSCWRLLCSCV
jgi:hypothetical protein